MPDTLPIEEILSSRDWYCDWVLSKKISVQIEAETERVLAFRHIKPNWDEHIVIIPKEHVTRLADVDDASILQEILTVARDLVRTKGWAETNYKLITNGGSYQWSQHLHFHLVSGSPVHDYGE